MNVNNEPYGHCSTYDFFPENIIKSVSSSFRFPDTVGSTSDPLFQKTKRSLNDYNLFPQEIKKTIDYLNSRSFIDILEEKFNIKNLLPDPSLFGGGMHESRNGGYLKIHSDFVYIRNKKQFDEPMDAIVYGTLISLGFATVENFEYVYKLLIRPMFCPSGVSIGQILP